MPHLLLLLTLTLHAQPTREGYARAANLSTVTANLDISIPGPATWINATNTFWYRRSIKGGHEFVIANGATKRPAFDHARLAAALSKAIGETYQSHTLPFQTLSFPSPKAIEFTVNQTRWRVNTQTYQPEDLGPEYIACSNAENASKLKGKLLLSVGELDNNVDPASTMQVVKALIKAKKTFDFIMLPGEGHSWGGVYGERKRWDFFVHNLLKPEPPDWSE